MKSKLLVSVSIIALLLAAVCVWQQRQLRAAQARLVQTERVLAAEKEARAEQENRSKTLERGQANLSQQLVDLSTLVTALRASEAKQSSNYARVAKTADPAASKPENDSDEAGLFGGKAFSGMVSKMMKDPAMKEMMRSQQKLAMNKMYGPLFKDLNLTGERKDKLMELLLDQQLKGVENAGAFFDKDGKFDTTKISEASKESETQTKDALKTLLTEQEFAYYEDYKKTMTDRMQLEDLKSHLEDTKSPLKDEQLRQLLAVFADERQKNPPIIPQDPQAAGANFEKMFSGDSMEKQIQWQEEMNRRVIERASQILDPEQLKSYTDFQAQQLNMQKFGMKMMRGMFSKKSTAADSVSPAENNAP